MSSGADQNNLTYDDIRHYFGNFDREVNISKNTELRKIIFNEKKTALAFSPIESSENTNKINDDVQIIEEDSSFKTDLSLSDMDDSCHSHESKDDKYEDKDNINTVIKF